MARNYGTFPGSFGVKRRRAAPRMNNTYTQPSQSVAKVPPTKSMSSKAIAQGDLAVRDLTRTQKSYRPPMSVRDNYAGSRSKSYTASRPRTRSRTGKSFRSPVTVRDLPESLRPSRRRRKSRRYGGGPNSWRFPGGGIS